MIHQAFKPLSKKTEKLLTFLSSEMDAHINFNGGLAGYLPFIFGSLGFAAWSMLVDPFIDNTATSYGGQLTETMKFIAVSVTSVIGFNLPPYLQPAIDYLYSRYNSFMRSYNGHETVTFADYANLHDTIYNFMNSEDSNIVNKNFIYYLETNNLSTAINTLLIMGAELSDFDKKFKKSKISNHFEATFAIDQLIKGKDEGESCALEDALLPYFIEDNDPEFKAAFLKGWEIRKTMCSTEIQNETKNDISYHSDPCAKR